MKPPTDYCPFCKQFLSNFYRASDDTERWHCNNCQCDTDPSMSKYLVICFDPRGQCAYQQEFNIDKFYIKNNYHSRETKIFELAKYLIISKVTIPFKEWDLSNEESLKQKLKLYLTFL